MSMLSLPAYIIVRRYNTPDEEKRHLLIDVIGFLGGDAFISQMVIEQLDKFNRFVNKNVLPKHISNPILGELEEIRLNIPELDERKKRSVDYILDRMKNHVEEYGNYSRTTYSEFELEKKKINQIINHDPKIKQVFYNQEIEDTISNYPERSYRQMKQFVEDIVLSSEGLPVFPTIYLLGEPGTGKTRFANSISELLGLPIFHLTDKDFGGRYTAQTNLSKFLINNDYNKNIILFIDEFDKIYKYSSNLKKQLLNLLEPTTGHYYCPYYDYKFDTTKCIFILAGNNIPEGSAALMNRVPVIEFESLSPKVRLEVAKKEMNDVFNSINFDHVIDDKDEEVINEVIELDTNKGVRVLSAIARKYALNIYKSSRNMCDYFDPQEAIDLYKTNEDIGYEEEDEYSSDDD